MAQRNYVHRRNHKERSQPEHRKRVGLLEKHKDYVERARAHHAKRDKLHRLEQKAAERNRDEFYLGMISGKTQAGVHVASRGNEPLDNDVVALLKTQDAAYVRRQRATERKRYRALVEQIAPRVPGVRLAWLQKKPELVTALRRAELLGDAVGADGPRGGRVGKQERVTGFGKRTVWVDDEDEARAYAAKRKRAKQGDGVVAKGHGLAEDAGDARADAERTGERQLAVKIRELATRQRRMDALDAAADKLDVVRNLMRTRGAHAVPKKHTQKLKSAVARDGARVTAHGLVVTGSDDEDAAAEQTKKQYKWSNERRK
ncbi:hypothetical protein MSPP1_002348 [Malassezia sp. CBS 17886]|nr:hypothetical protein MSPP1_002348 [Malassezia sp. CBS 17886]